MSLTRFARDYLSLRHTTRHCNVGYHFYVILLADKVCQEYIIGRHPRRDSPISEIVIFDYFYA